VLESVRAPIEERIDRPEVEERSVLEASSAAGIVLARGPA
jgi:hypothetical protein